MICELIKSQTIVKTTLISNCTLCLLLYSLIQKISSFFLCLTLTLVMLLRLPTYSYTSLMKKKKKIESHAKSGLLISAKNAIWILNLNFSISEGNVSNFQNCLEFWNPTSQFLQTFKIVFPKKSDSHFEQSHWSLLSTQIFIILNSLQIIQSFLNGFSSISLRLPQLFLKSK